MGRKRSNTGFQWVREDQDDSAREPVIRQTHRETREADARMEKIANLLLSRAPSDRAPLDLPSVLTEALTEHPRLTGTARNRNMRRLKGLLRGLDDIDALEEALSGETIAERRAHALERWRTRLLSGDDTDLQAFMDQHPSADRSAIRTLVRTARKSDERGSKASKKLFQVLKSAPPAGSE